MTARRRPQSRVVPDLLIDNARQVVLARAGTVRALTDGAVLVRGGRIAWVGPRRELPRRPRLRLNARGGVVLPGFVDCHTHAVFAGTRVDEFARRLAGATYRELQEAGGGILRTVDATRRTSVRELLALARPRLARMVEWGTTTVEIKSGYGLDTPSELKLLAVIDRLRRDGPLTVVPTFLGAHAIPRGQTRADYTRQLVAEMIPAVARTGQAQFCDIFCERFVFDYRSARAILRAARTHGLQLKVHADEIGPARGAELAGELGAVSAEHLIHPGERGLRALARAGTTAVLLPGTSLCLRLTRRPPVARMRALGITLALGSDFNPGSCMIYAMPLIVALGCLLYDLAIEEALHAATLGAARALGLDATLGSIAPGKAADLLITDLADYRELAYEPGRNPVRVVVKSGRVIHDRG